MNMLNDDLLELQSLTNGDSSNIANDDVLLLSGGVLRLINGVFFSYEETPQDSITVTGYWGYHPNWESAWADSGDTVQDNPLSASATTLTVNDADAGSPARFQVGQLLRIESEYLRVTAVDSTNNLLTVARGVQGTTAASHSVSTAIEIYQTPEDVALLTVRWATWLYREIDSELLEIPPALLSALNGLRRVGVAA